MTTKISIFLLTVFFLSCQNESKESNETKESQTDTITEEKTDSIVVEAEDIDTLVITESAPIDCEINLEAYIDDPSETPTNLRKSPGGEVAMQLPVDDYFITIDAQEGGWFHISSLEGVEAVIEIPENGLWIHSSVVGASSRNYGSQQVDLYNAPDENATITGNFKQEIAFHVVGICNDWVQIQATFDKSIKGWIKKEWVCGNPLTNCS